MGFEIESSKKLSRDFYRSGNVTNIARSLVGKYLITDFDSQLTVGRIVETEAYNGREDKACHAFLKRTKRTEIMYGPAGFSYIYLCYGIHHLFNIVTNDEGMADAVLIRALEPIEGLQVMARRRGDVEAHRLANGPGLVSKAMGLNKGLSGTDLTGDQIWIAEYGQTRNIEIETDRRVGVDYAEEDALLPWRFYEKGNRCVSRKRQKDVDISKFQN